MPALSPRSQHTLARLAAHTMRCSVCDAEPAVVASADGFTHQCPLHPEAAVVERTATK